MHEGHVLQDITGARLHQNSANVHVFQHRASGCSSLSPGTAQNRALPNTFKDIVVKGYGRCCHGNYRAHMRIPDVTDITAHDRAVAKQP